MTQLTHGECAPVTRRRTCPSPTRRELWRLVRIILRNRRVHSHRPDNGRRRRLHARKQMRMVGADARSMQSPRTMHRRQSRPDDADFARMRARNPGKRRALPPPRSKQRVCGCHRTTKKAGPFSNLTGSRAARSTVDREYTRTSGAGGPLPRGQIWRSVCDMGFEIPMPTPATISK